MPKYFMECGKSHYFLRVVGTNENADILIVQDEIYLVFSKKK